MTDHVYKKLEITGSSTNSMEDAINNAISRAAKTLHSLKWFEMVEVRGDINNGAVSHWQVTLKVGLTLDD